MAAGLRCQKPRDEQQGVAGKEETDQETTLSKDDAGQEQQTARRQPMFDIHGAELSSTMGNESTSEPRASAPFGCATVWLSMSSQ